MLSTSSILPLNLMDMLCTGNDKEKIVKNENCGYVVMFVALSVYVHPGQCYMQSLLFC